MRGPCAPEAFRLIRADFEKLILPLADLGCLIASALGTGLPEITDDYIQFNRIRHCGHQKVDGPVVIFPAEDACGVDSDYGKLFAVAFLGLIAKRRCDGQCCHDDFWLGKQVRPWLLQECIQALRLAVTAALLIAKHHWGENFEITSCGSDTQWWDAKLICQRILGYGASFKFVRKWRPPTPLELGSEAVEVMSLEEL